MTGSRATRLAYYSLPMLFCLAVHWTAIRTWFRADDFAWLGLRLEIHSPQDLLRALFEPRAQGTVRTFSDRLYFLLFPLIFGLNAWPMRLWEFITQFTNIALLISITRRITGSTLAAFLAPILWCACAPSAIPLGWSSAYNEICFAFFLLLAFYLLLRFIETGESKFWIAQWVVFLLGFGALELNVMYPVLAAGYALCCARHVFRRTLYLFIPSILFTLLHLLAFPKTNDPQYAMHFNSEIVSNLWNYWAFTLGAWRPQRLDWRPLWLGVALTIAVTAALLAFIAIRLRHKDWRAVFLLAWFFVVIAPLIPLTQHATEYYPLIPAIGLAMLASWALASRGGRWGYPLAALFLVLSITDVHIADKYFYSRARLMKRLVKGLEAHRAEYAGKTVFLNGVNNEMFWSGFFDDPFRLIGISEVYLTPGSEARIDPHPEWGGIARFTMPHDSAMQELNANRATVYSVTPEGIQNVTPTYLVLASAAKSAQQRESIDVGNPSDADRLGPGWYKIENGARWMGKSASVDLSGPKDPEQKLWVSGYCPAAALANGPLSLTISVDGKPIGRVALRTPNDSFNLNFPIPANLVNKSSMDVTAEVSRTFTLPSDQRALGLIFGTFRIK